MEAAVRAFFEHYAQVFKRALGGDEDMTQVAALYAAEFIVSTPQAVLAGKNGAELNKVMVDGYARYRAMGMTDMALSALSISPIDDHHCLAHVAWRATYARKDREDVVIAFEVHYFVRRIDEDPKVFGWVSGDEQAVLAQHGVI